MIDLFAAALLASQGCAGAFSIETEAAILSDYRWRGVSLSDEEPSLQLAATGSFDGGAWTWMGLNSVSESVGGAEIGLGIGYDVAHAALDWSFAVTAYVYPGAEDLDYVEINLSAGKSLGLLTFSAGLDYVPEQANAEIENAYLWIGADAEFGRLGLHARFGEDDGFIDRTGHASDYSLGAGVAMQDWSADISFVNSEAAEGAWVLRFAVAR